SLTADGRVTFEGRNYTRVKGDASGTIDRDKLIDLVKGIKKSDFFSLSEDPGPPVVDAPTYSLAIRMNGRDKTVTAGPRRFDLLMARIDQIVNSDQWITCNPKSSCY